MMNRDFNKFMATRRAIDKALENWSFDEKISILAASIDMCIMDAGKNSSEVWSGIYENSRIIDSLFGFLMKGE